MLELTRERLCRFIVSKIANSTKLLLCIENIKRLNVFPKFSVAKSFFKEKFGAVPLAAQLRGRYNGPWIMRVGRKKGFSHFRYVRE